MPEQANQNGPVTGSGFTAFISYSQRDRRRAKRLHLALKAYCVPRDISVPGLPEDRGLGPIFRDEENMAAHPSLHQALNLLIDSSRHLIVVCTPDSARSEWVDKEVRRFKRRKQPNVFAVIARGRPHSDNVETECFCPSLATLFDDEGNPTKEPDEPLAANLLRESHEKVVARLAAGLLGIPFDDLWRHDRRRARRRRTFIGVVGVAATMLLLVSIVEAVRSSDASMLVAQSVQISQEAWRRGSDDRAFHPAFRAALAATRLPGAVGGRNTTAADCNLNGPIETAACALAVSGTALPRAAIFNERPDTPRANFRDDIPGARGIERRARNLPSVRSLAFSGNSKRIAMAHDDGRLLVYDRTQARTVLNIDRIAHRGGPVALNNDGTQALLTTGEEMYLVLLDVKSGRTTYFPFLFDQVHEVKFTEAAWLVVASGRQNETSNRKGAVVVLKDGDVTRETPIEEYTPYFSSGFTDSGAHFMSFTSKRLFDVDVGAGTVREIVVPKLGDGVGQVKALATDRHGDWVVIGGNGSGGDDNAAQVVSVRGSDVPAGSPATRERSILSASFRIRTSWSRAAGT